MSLVERILGKTGDGTYGEFKHSKRPNLGYLFMSADDATDEAMEILQEDFDGPRRQADVSGDPRSGQYAGNDEMEYTGNDRIQYTGNEDVQYTGRADRPRSED